MRRAPMTGTMVITAAIIVGWLWRIAYVKWPDVQPVLFLAGLFVTTVLAEVIERRIDRASVTTETQPPSGGEKR